MTAQQWNRATLEAARQRGDRLGDDLAALILKPTLPQEGIHFADQMLQVHRDLAARVPARAKVEPTDLATAIGLADEIQRHEHLAVTASLRRSLELAEKCLRVSAAELSEDHLEGWEASHRMAGATLGDFREQLVAARDAGGYDQDQISQWRRRGYNYLLVLADKLVQNPSLYMIPDSEVTRELGNYPAALLRFFEPEPCPDWVSPTKLEIGSGLWQFFILEALITLYAGSLPSCYLMADGIPLLYKTGKLASKDFIYQRLYETCLMVDGVMDERGIRVIEDIPTAEPDLFKEAVNKVKPEVNFRWGPGGIPTWDGPHAKLPNWRDLQVEIENLKRKRGLPLVPNRYLTGRGVSFAKRVRLLHSTMRVMCLNPELAHSDRFRVEASHPVEEHGYPINQKDLAFTLLTFGLVIPDGLSKWGLSLKREELAGFLHTWRVVGHLMGVEEELMTDDPDEARELYQTIRGIWGEPSEMAKELTDTVCEVLRDFIPRWLPLRTALPPLLIKSQLKDEWAENVLSEEQQKASRSWTGRCGWLILRCALWVYLRVKSRVFHRGGLPLSVLKPIVHDAGEALFESWRGLFDRRAFFLPSSLEGGWQREEGIGEGLKEQVYRWQTKVFLYVGGGLLAAIVAVITGALAALAGTLELAHDNFAWPATDYVTLRFFAASSITALATGLGSYYLLSPGLEKLKTARPLSASEQAAQG